MSVAPDGLVRRAARHAALGDTARLRVVDLLTLGDASPGELQSALGIASNLLAHHLGVLTAAGLVTRTRSQADRRRTYLHLATDLTDERPAALTARRVVFVCTGNSARSPLAAALWRRASTVPAVSAGTHPAPAVEPGAVVVAGRHELNLDGTVPSPLGDVLRDGDAIVTVCDAAHEELGATGRLHWSVPDPVRVGTDAAFEAAFGDLAHRIATLAAHVRAA